MELAYVPARHMAFVSVPIELWHQVFVFMVAPVIVDNNAIYLGQNVI